MVTLNIKVKLLLAYIANCPKEEPSGLTMVCRSSSCFRQNQLLWEPFAHLNHAQFVCEPHPSAHTQLWLCPCTSYDAKTAHFSNFHFTNNRKSGVQWSVLYKRQLALEHIIGIRVNNKEEWNRSKLWAKRPFSSCWFWLFLPVLNL